MEPQRASKPPAQELVGQSPPIPTRLLVAGPGPDSLATERGRSVRDSTPPRKRSRSPRAPSLHLRTRFRSPMWRGKHRCTLSQPLHGSDGAQGERSVPTVGVRSCSERSEDAKRRPRVTWARIARPKSRVGVAGLRPAEPEREKVWKPSQGFHSNVRRAGHFVPPLQPFARRARELLSNPAFACPPPRESP